MPSSPIIVRPVEISDFGFIRELASQQPNFTIPPPYVLWLLLKINPGFCLIAVHADFGPLAYLLAVPIEAPAPSVFIWQLAAAEHRTASLAVEALLRRLKELTEQLRIEELTFSAIPESASFRLIKRYINSLGWTARLSGPIPPFVAPGESEYRISLRDKLSNGMNFP